MTKHLKLLTIAAKKEGVELEPVSYNRVFFDTDKGEVMIRGPKNHLNRIGKADDYEVLFFRTTGKHWEEVDLIINSIRRKDVVVVDPLVRWGKPSFACKAYQMLELQRAGIKVPRSVYGSLWYLYEIMFRQNTFSFPVVLKGSGGDRGTRVYKADTLEQLEKLVRDLRKSETEEGKRYMLQEMIENKGDYRVLVLGEKVLGVMKRTRQTEGEFRNNFSMGGKVEIGDLPEWVKQKAVEATRVCGLMVAGVDIIFENGNYFILEVNKGPQFWGFMEATKIDVPREIIKFLKSL